MAEERREHGMSTDVEPNSSEDGSPATDISRSTKPKGVYLVAFWCIFGLTMFGSSIFLYAAAMLPEYADTLMTARMGYFLIVIGVAIGVIRFSRAALIVCGSLMALAALFQLYSLMGLVWQGSISGQVIAVKAFVGLPSALGAWYCFRPAVLARATRFADYKNQMAMQRYIHKSLMKR